MFKICINPLETLGIDVYVLTNALFFNQRTSDAVVQLLLAGVQSYWRHARPAVFINLTHPSPINCQSLNSAKYPMIFDSFQPNIMKMPQIMFICIGWSQALYLKFYVKLLIFFNSFYRMNFLVWFYLFFYNYFHNTILPLLVRVVL